VTVSISVGTSTVLTGDFPVYFWVPGVNAGIVH
jgi:hypothetical protein